MSAVFCYGPSAMKEAVKAAGFIEEFQLLKKKKFKIFLYLLGAFCTLGVVLTVIAGIVVIGLV